MHTLNGIPLSAVLWGHLPEVGLDDSSILVRAKAALISANTEILLSLALENRLKTSCGLAVK
jgi:hypothetical protein